MPEPYALESVDMESIICLMEDCLVAGQEAETKSALHSNNFAATACTEMVTDLTKSILQSYESSSILAMMQDLGIDTPLLASVVASLGDVASEAAILEELQPSFEESSPATKDDVARTTTVQSPPLEHVSSKDVATLVSNLGSAPEGPARDAALETLRNYTAANGDEEVVEHLKQVSPAFREFIEGLLRRSADGTSSGSISLPTSPKSAGTSSMSERLRHLRSRLQATEIVVQSAVEGKPKQPALSTNLPPGTVKPPSTTESGIKRSSPSSTKILSPTSRTSGLAKPTPSKIPTVIAGSSQPHTLLERLAASQESRINTGITSATGTTSSSTSDGVSSSMGRAAALRARLEAVKQKNKQKR